MVSKFSKASILSVSLSNGPYIKDNGAKAVHAYTTHPVLSGPAIDRLNKSKIKTLTVTNTIPLCKNAKKCKKIRKVSVAELIGEAIQRIYEEDSLTVLFV